MAIRFKPNPAAGAELAKAPEMMAFLLADANIAAETARSQAPRLTGAYAASIHAEVEAGRARVIADDEKAVWIEFGTGHPGPTPAFHVLSRSVESLGIRMVG